MKNLDVNTIGLLSNGRKTGNWSIKLLKVVHKKPIFQHNITEKRVGRPRYKWSAAALDRYWLLIRGNSQFRHAALDWDNEQHTDIIRNALRKNYLAKPPEWPTDAQRFNPKR